MNTQPMKPSDLKPYAQNPRVNDSAVDRVAKSIADYGFRQPVVVDKDHVIIVGHTRVKAAIKLGMETVPVHVAADMTPEQARAYRIADNKLNELATWDKDLLPLELADLKGMDIDLNGLGFTDADLESILGQGGSGKDGECDPDDVPDAVEPVTKPGDLWILGEHRVLCGDSTKAEDVARVMDGQKAGLMFTDPPYGVTVAGGTHDPRDVKNYRSGGTIKNDELTGDKLGEFLGICFTHAVKMLAPGAAWYVWYAATETRAVLGAVDVLGGMKHVLVWVKPNFVFGRCDYHYRHEPCMYGWTDGRHVWLGDRKQDSVWEARVGEDLEKKRHPTAKPVALPSKAINNHLGAGGLVYDPFLGSGTTVIAAERQGRRCYGMEISPAYCDLIVARWEKFTGKKAELSNAIGTQAATNGTETDSRKHGKAQAEPKRAKAGRKDTRVSAVAR